MAFDIKVQNIKDPIPEGYWGVHIMHPYFLKSPYIPNDIHDDNERKECLAKYKQYLWEQMRKPNSPIMKALIKLAQTANDITLICYCSPKGCHGDIIKAAIEWIRNNKHVIPVRKWDNKAKAA